ncbi:Rtf2 RING-finger [Carpediemonas membranifera]|uniref:Rtf2 RING-finger n=1 Tax=Carpediemonas membranifera TaxID=201153 RepID=A0A8J6AWH5_9EUKA|nr:Rtf2 RING-finger [Carpediemonas membranifera]|eukprot:KAG9390033.1 Rtf2 RING-finger [Carpediemonas membranifera]
MGADGGLKFKQSDVFKDKTPETKTLASVHAAELRARRCALSNEPLQEPICCDKAGRLYNYEAVLEALLSHTVPPPLAPWLCSRADVLTLDPTLAPPHNGPGEGPFPLVCPLTGSSVGAGGSFVAIKPCGHVVRADRWTGMTCPLCDADGTAVRLLQNKPVAPRRVAKVKGRVKRV